MNIHVKTDQKSSKKQKLKKSQKLKQKLLFLGPAECAKRLINKPTLLSPLMGWGGKNMFYGMP